MQQQAGLEESGGIQLRSYDCTRPVNELLGAAGHVNVCAMLPARQLSARDILGSKGLLCRTGEVKDSCPTECTTPTAPSLPCCMYCPCTAKVTCRVFCALHGYACMHACYHAFNVTESAVELGAVCAASNCK